MSEFSELQVFVYSAGKCHYIFLGNIVKLYKKY